MMLRSIRSKTGYVAIFLILLGIVAVAQDGQLAGSDNRKSGFRIVPSMEQKRALETLIQLFELSRESQDQVFAIEAEADIADALWEDDRKRARSFFADAFRAVDSLKSDERDPGRTAIAQPAAETVKAGLRTRIAALISRRDPALAENLIGELLKIADHAPPDKSTLYSGMAITAAGADPQRAVKMARAALGSGITPGFIGSLLAIRAVQPELADGLFYESLAVAAQDVDNFSNDLRLLASYVFAPGSDTANDTDGNDTTNQILAPAASNAGLITDFLNFALQTSLALQAAGGVRSVPGLSSYVPLMQLLPYYERYLPDTAAAIAAAFNQLVAAVPDSQKRSLLVNLVARPSVDQIIQAGNSLVKTEQRDLLYERAALQASSKGDYEQALTTAESISREEIRRRVKSTVYEQAAIRELNKGNVDAACNYAIEIPDLLPQSQVFAQIMRMLLQKKELVRANDVLDVAERQITKVGESPEKARALLLLSRLAEAIDKVRALTMLQLAVATINHSDFSSNHKAKAAASSIEKKSETPAPVAAPSSFSFHQSFGVLASVDFDTTLSLAQSIAKREISIRAQIAACRGVLQRKGLQDSEVNNPKELPESPSSGSRHRLHTEASEPARL